jgi:tetratricopeptide (TPR) repeat protein
MGGGMNLLRGLDARRRTEPDAVLDELHELLRQKRIVKRDLPFALSIAGACFRARAEFRKAESHIQRGIFFAQGLAKPVQEGQLVNQLAMVCHHADDNLRALKENARAIWTLMFHSIEDVGRCLVDRGVILGSLEEYEKARLAFYAALARLPTGDDEYLFCAHQGLTEVFVQLEQPNQAVNHAKKAVLFKAFPEATAKLLWSGGMLLARHRRFVEAAEQVEVALKILRKCSPIDAALASIDLCKIYLQIGKGLRARELATAILNYIDPLRSASRVAASAAIELATLADRGEGLTLGQLEAIRTKVSRAQVRTN